MAAEPQDVSNDLDEDLFDFPVVAPFGASRTAASSGGGTDDDLFGDALDDGEHGVRAAVEEGGALEDDIDRLTDQVSGMIEEDDLDRYLEDAPAASRPPASETPMAASAQPSPSAPSHPTASAADPIVAATAPPAPPAPGAVSAGPSALGRTGALLLGGAALFAVLLLGVVWNASRGVQQALSQRPAPPSAPEVDPLQQRIAELEATLAAQREEMLVALDARQEKTLSGLPMPADVEPAWSVERTLIDEALEEGRYREARRRLYGLQAVLDDLHETVSAELAPTIAFLIPETYRLQARAEGEER